MSGTTVGTPIWEAKGREKRAAVQSMFSGIAASYDRLNRIMSLNQDGRWRQAAVRAVAPAKGEIALDLCTGTGDFLPILRRVVGDTGTVIGLDFCAPMLEVAQQKHLPNLGLGDAVQLPVASASVDVVTVGWGIRNVPDIDAAHAEIFRVLKPGGRFVSIDMAIPNSKLVRAGSRFVSTKVLPTLGRLFRAEEAYTYLPESTERFLSRQALVDSMTNAGFSDVQFRDFMFGNICMHYGKKK